MKKLFFAALLSAAAQLSSAAEGVENAYKKISFVCEHGVAKSVIATQYFNRLATARGLKYRAVSRGISSETELQPAAVAGLKKDGFDMAGIKPSDLASIDYETSEKVVLIGIEKSPDFAISKKSVNWIGVPSVSKDYDLARDDMLGRIEKLILSLPNY
jgi:arsenate reductase